MRRNSTRRSALDLEKVEVANKVLSLFANDTYITYKGNQIYVGFCGKEWRYATKERSMFPTWHSRWHHGGTACQALYSLVRWIRGKPTLPIGVWKMWAGECYRLLPLEAIGILIEAGYPTEAFCVKCGKKLDKGFDWWDDGKVSGPAHFKCEQ